MPPSGRQHSAVMAAVETPDLGGGGAIEAPKRSAVGDIERLAVGGEVLGRVELPDKLGLFQDLVRLQRAVERRHRDGCVTPPQQAVGEGLQRCDHLLLPQRRSYWTKSGSAPAELVAADPVVGDAAEIEIAAVLAHRGDHRMVDAVQVPERLEHFAALVEFDHASGVDIREQPLVDRNPLAHPLAEARHLPGEIERGAAHADHRQPVVSVRCAD